MKKKVLTAIIIIILAAAAAAAAAFFAVYGDRSPGWHDSAAGFRYYADESGEIARGYRFKFNVAAVLRDILEVVGREADVGVGP